MIIPPTLKILGLQWTVLCNQDVSNASEAHGTTVHSNQTINIEPNMTPLHSEQTFLHEILHAIFWQMGLTKLEYMDGKKEEQLVNTLANGLCQVLKDNNLLA